MQTDVVIIGGGLAGLSCALGLADSGLSICVLEATDQLGGRARSWTHAPTGDTVDIGPHIVLSHYPNFLGLLEQLGTRDRICWQTDRLITLVNSGHRDVMRVHRLPPPLQLVPSLLRARAVGFHDKLSNARASWAAMKVDENLVRKLDRISAVDYVRSHGVSAEFREWFWNSACLALMNVPLEICSAGALLRVYAQLIGHNDYAIGFANCGLSELYVQQICSRLVQHGHRVLTDHAARGISVTANGFSVHIADRESVRTRFVVCALPPQQLAFVASDVPALASVVRNARTFRPSPYVSIYLWFDRKLTNLKFWSGVWSPQRLNYDFYDLSNIREGWSSRPSVVASNIIYNARSQTLTDDELISATIDEISEFAPEVRESQLLHADVHRIDMAIPAPLVGTESLRPATQTALPRCYMAGDWTQTGLPSSMESAVRSGWLASEALWQDIGERRTLAQAPPETMGLPGFIRRTAARHRRGPQLP